MDRERIARYRDQSQRFLAKALNEVHQKRWERVEDLLWGSLGAAVKAVALSRGIPLEGNGAVERYAHRLGREISDRKLSSVLSQVFDSTARKGPLEPRFTSDYLHFIHEEVSFALQSLWELTQEELA